MKAHLRSPALAFVGGLLFAIGLAVAGMTRPSKVIGFLDFADGSWDPSLALVMVGAIAVYAAAHRLVRRWTSPLLAPRWSFPTRRDIDGRLLLGAAVFGIGWGLSGLCPGPALVSLTTGHPGTWIFVGSMVLAMWLTAQAANPRILHVKMVLSRRRHS